MLQSRLRRWCDRSLLLLSPLTGALHAIDLLLSVVELLRVALFDGVGDEQHFPVVARVVGGHEGAGLLKQPPLISSQVGSKGRVVAGSNAWNVELLNGLAETVEALADIWRRAQITLRLLPLFQLSLGPEGVGLESVACSLINMDKEQLEAGCQKLFFLRGGEGTRLGQDGAYIRSQPCRWALLPVLLACPFCHILQHLQALRSPQIVDDADKVGVSLDHLDQVRHEFDAQLLLHIGNQFAHVA